MVYAPNHLRYLSVLAKPERYEMAPAVNLSEFAAAVTRAVFWDAEQPVYEMRFSNERAWRNSALSWRRLATTVETRLPLSVAVCLASGKLATMGTG